MGPAFMTLVMLQVSIYTSTSCMTSVMLHVTDIHTSCSCMNSFHSTTIYICCSCITWPPRHLSELFTHLRVAWPVSCHVISIYIPTSWMTWLSCHMSEPFTHLLVAWSLLSCYSPFFFPLVARPRFITLHHNYLLILQLPSLHHVTAISIFCICIP